jgi:hypothetical protein
MPRASRCRGGAAPLHQRTEGWAAGLRLAALSLVGHPDPERFVAEFSGSDRTVAEYLIAEMLERQPPDVQDLLLRTSLLDRVNGELADLLTGRPGSEQILLDLEDANAFVESLDSERSWFRHPPRNLKPGAIQRHGRPEALDHTLDPHRRHRRTPRHRARSRPGPARAAGTPAQRGGGMRGSIRRRDLLLVRRHVDPLNRPMRVFAAHPGLPPSR